VGGARARRRGSRCGDVRPDVGGGGIARLQLPDLLLELPVAELQFFILASELPQLILKLLHPQFRIDVVGLRLGLRKTMRRKRQHRGEYDGAGNDTRSG